MDPFDLERFRLLGDVEPKEPERKRSEREPVGRPSPSTEPPSSKIGRGRQIPIRNDSIGVVELADLTGLTVGTIIKRLRQMGVIGIRADTFLDPDTAALVAVQFGFRIAPAESRPSGRVDLTDEMGEIVATAPDGTVTRGVGESYEVPAWADDPEWTADQQAPTTNQLAFIRLLAEKRGVKVKPPKTRSEAGALINRLNGRGRKG